MPRRTLARALLLAAPALLSPLAGCGTSFFDERYEVRSSYSDGETIPAETRQQIATYLEDYFGYPTAPWVNRGADAGIPGYNFDTDHLRYAAALYREHCLHCHGLSGGADGPTVGQVDPPNDYGFLNPRPRDFRLGLFKFTSTAWGQKPLREDLLRTLEHGVAGTAMPAFNLMPAEDREALVDYVAHLAIRGELELRLQDAAQAGDDLTPDLVAEEADLIHQSWNHELLTIVEPQGYVPFSPESVAAGYALYCDEELGCMGCHGPTGRGDGTGAADMDVDAWGFTQIPADLTRGLYRHGRRPLDLYRAIRAGLSGTAMPDRLNLLSDEQTWHLVNFVYTLPYHNPTELVAAPNQSPNQQETTDRAPDAEPLAASVREPLTPNP